MVPVFERKKTGWLDRLGSSGKETRGGDGERAVATPVYPAWSREEPLFPGRLV
jgi:hypothetical protein